MTNRALILALDRERGLGEQRRIDTWRTVLEGAGTTPTVLPLLRAAHRSGPNRARWPDPVAVVRRRAAPETLSWSWPAVRHAIEAESPDLLVAVTVRAFHPGLAELAPLVVLDFVDRLSVSYRDRARITTSWPRRTLFSVLAATTAVLEQAPLPSNVRTVAAGHGDAEALGASWVPNVVDIPGPRLADADPDHDLLFFGNLGYPPNVAAVGYLDRVWPSIRRLRPKATLLLAGRAPSPTVTALAARHGWTLEVDFADLDQLCQRARLAVAPLTHTAGIQNKVLEAASRGLAQVVLPEVMTGLGPDFPARVATDERSFVEAIVDLLEDDSGRAELGRRGREHVAEFFAPARWSAWLASNGLVPA